MLFGNYRFICQLTADTVLPPYKGSTIRGILGRSIKKTVCIFKKQDCDSCLLKQNCLYSAFFENSSSPPFVLEPPLTEKTDFSKDDLLEFNLILFGEITKELPYVIYALKEGKLPVGKSKEAKLNLKEVKKDNRTIYSEAENKIYTENLYSELKIPDLGKKENTKIRLHLITPLRVKFRNRLTEELPFHILIRTVLRRIHNVFYNYGKEEPKYNYRELIKKAESVKIVESNTKWFDWKRYSSRQEKAMFMGGITGSVVYEGELGEFIPLIKLCEILHLGKQTSFGLGKIKIEEVA